LSHFNSAIEEMAPAFEHQPAAEALRIVSGEHERASGPGAGLEDQSA